MVKGWQKHETYEFPSNLGLAHDLIDYQQPNQPIEIIYPELIDLIMHAD
jgi:hypothetical protein